MIYSIPFRQIRAVFDDTTITVYQAFNAEIAKKAEKAKTFVPPFKKERMTWIKPSFLWMMARSGWATKPNQEHILAIKISRDGFEWALRNSCLSSFDKHIHRSYDDWTNKIKETVVRIQWDPERDINLNAVNYKTIQVGLSSIAVEKYLNEWISDISDITPLCKQIHIHTKDDPTKATNLLPQEYVYSLSSDLKNKIGIRDD